MALKAALLLPLSGAAREASRLFDAASSQWQIGMAGAVGLLYGGVESAARALQIDWVEAFPYLQVLEFEQLEVWAEERKANKKK